RRNLAKHLLPGQPDFNVISLGGRSTHIACTKTHDPIMQSKLLQNLFGISRELFVFLVGMLRTHEFYEFHLLKLMLPDNPSHIFAVRPSLAAETRRVRSQGNRQASLIQNLIAI